MRRILREVKTGRKCEIEGSSHKGEDIIEKGEFAESFGAIEESRKLLCQYYQGCYIRRLNKITEK